MNEQDILWSKGCYTVFENITVATTATKLLSANPDRIAIAISGPNTNRITIGGDAGVTDLNGVVLHTVDPTLLLSSMQFPGLPAKELWAISINASEIIAVWSVYHPCDCLRGEYNG